MAPQVPPVIPVPSLPSSAEATQAAVFPAVRETPTFKSREDHELTTVKKILLNSLSFVFFSFLLFANEYLLMSYSQQNGNARRLIPAPPGRKRKANCGGTDEVRYLDCLQVCGRVIRFVF